MERFFVPGKPCFYLVQCDPSTFDSLGLQLTLRSKEHVIRVIQGKRCMDLNCFFGEIAAALQFPYYFGENWPAFHDCITDMEWAPAPSDAYLLLVHDARLLLYDAHPADFPTLLKHLMIANEEWLTPDAWFTPPDDEPFEERPPMPFHVLFQCTADEIDEVAQRFATTGFGFERIVAVLQDTTISVRTM